MLSKVLLVLPIYILVISLFILNSYGHSLAIKENIAIVQSETNIESISTYREGIPISIYFPSLDLKLPVILGEYYQDSRQWLLTSDKAQFATQTRPANNRSGMTLIYGHNNRKVFKSTEKLNTGALAIVYTENHYTFTYRLTSNQVVKPTDTSLFEYKGSPRLTVLTCTGEWYQNRHLMNFTLVTVRKTH